jgi:transcriptional regulator with XRE-family HTH domain
MSTADYSLPQLGNGSSLPLGLAPLERTMHRLKTVRRREGVSQSTVARRLGIPLGEVKSQEEETNDLPLSALYRWQDVLQVPLMELLADPPEPLSEPVMQRAKLVRLMKTARAIQQRTRQESVQRMAQVLVEQLLDLMPELEDVTPWPEIGQPRTLAELGQAAQRRLSDDALSGLADTA